MDIKFLLIFITLSLFLYIVFYYLGIRKENYVDYNPYHAYDNYNNHIIRNNLEELEEETRMDIKDFIESKKDNISKLEHQEEESYYPPIQEETKTDNSNTKPDINRFILDNPIKNGTPLNINISYNSQNSVNEIDNNSSSKDCNKENKCNERKENKSKNLGNNCDNSRIYNNSDWIYGSSAWTNDPDYYIPEKNKIKEIPQPLNELINSKKYKENKNDVCPLMINTPWTEYKSGDSEPEPYNL